MRRRTYDLQRRKPVRNPVRKFFLYCEGENTERGYFAAIQQKYAALLEIEYIGPAGVPKTLAAKAVARLKELKERIASGEASSFEEKDEVWAVYDRDEFDCYYDATRMCQAAGVGVGRSNPCFEVWLILHEEDFHQPVDRKKVCDHLRKIRNDYDKKSKVLNFSEIVSKIDAAEARAIKQMKARRNEMGGKILGHPYTTVNDLTASIRRAAAESEKEPKK